MVPIKRAKRAQTIGVTRHWPRLFLLPGEHASELLPGSPETLPVSVVKANQEPKNGGERGLECTAVGWGCGENDE